MSGLTKFADPDCSLSGRAVQWAPDFGPSLDFGRSLLACRFVVGPLLGNKHTPADSSWRYGMPAQNGQRTSVLPAGDNPLHGFVQSKCEAKWWIDRPWVALLIFAC